MSQKIIVFTGAGVSAESGINTFRDQGGLWEKHDVTEIATPQAWAKNPKMVLEFYNQRRKQMHEVNPNPAHKAIAALEKHYNVVVITQNV
ncbi:MAG TPA: Sir2 family NAD-dependent protein deacetylase, partial [Marinilabiliaceae bacterium]|nr:Sir2 family NAD-dependent protein deacetylase [Marinilabiliaceae bacterium]